MPRLLASRTNNLTDRFINGRDLHPYLKRDFWLNSTNHFWLAHDHYGTIDFSVGRHYVCINASYKHTPASRAYFETNLQTINEHGQR